MNGASNRKSRKPLLFLLLLCIVSLSGVSLWAALRHGIVFDRISLPSVTAERISIQLLDGGFVVSVDRLDISAHEKSPSPVDPKLFISRFNEIASLCQEIKVNRIRYRGRSYHLLFKDNQFTVSSDKFQLTSSVAFQGRKALLELSKLTVRPYPVTLTGNAIFNLESEQLSFSGRFTGEEISGRLEFTQRQNQIDAEIRSDSFTDLPGLLELFSLDRKLTSWIGENVTAEDYLIDSLRLQIPLQDWKPDFSSASISGRAIATAADITFHPDLPPVHCPRIDIFFADDRLSFKLDKSEYKTRSLAGSSVTISHLLAGGSQMDIHLQTETRLDRDILNLLETYDIHLPLWQQTGTTRADLHLVFDLPDFTLRAEGVFSTGQGSWRWGDISFQADEAEVQLKDNLIAIKVAEITYLDMLRANLTGTFDPALRKAALTAAVENLNLREKGKEIMTVRNLTTPVSIQFSNDDVNIHLLQLQTTILLGPSRRLVTLENLTRVKSFLPSLSDLPFQDGQLSINFTAPDNLSFEGFIDTKVLPLSLNDQPVTHFTFQGSRTSDKLTATANEGKISLTMADNVHLDLRDYQVTFNTDKFSRKAGSSSPLPISISGPRSLIKLHNISIPTRVFRAELKGLDVSFSAALDQGKILFESDGLNMALAASDIDAQIARDFFPFADLEGGRFDLTLKGTDEQNFEGYVEFSSVLIKDVSLLNNVLSFINAVPALATFSSPGFDADGYLVNQGVARFARSKNLLTIQQLRADGTTINTEADGWVDIENDILKINLELISLKDYSKIISKIPWAGYAILGKNGSLSTSLFLSGDRHNPEIKTDLPKEIVMLPIKIVKRTIEWPFRLFGKIKDITTEMPEPEK